MEGPINDDIFFEPGDVNICIFPHLREFLVVDARATVPGGPHSYLMKTEDVLDHRFYREIETTLRELVEETPHTFSELGHLPQRVDDAIRELALNAILREIGSEDLIENDSTDVSVFLCAGPALSMGAAQLDETVRAMLGSAAYVAEVEHCSFEMRRLIDEERAHAQTEEGDMARRAVAGDADFYFTIWSAANESDDEDV
ncbi:MAG: hypothetical protein WD533_04735 [Dehalococcoidia bacterium]